MKTALQPLTRRMFLALGAAAVPAALEAQNKGRRKAPIGVLLFAVQKELDADFEGTLRTVAGFGYQGVEFTHYIDWTPARAKEIRQQLDRYGLTCYSTHNEPQVFVDRLDHAIEINHILASRSISCVRGLAAKPGGAGFAATGIDGWKKLTDVLQRSAERLKKEEQRCAFHNHSVEFEVIEGQRPIDILASAPDLFFQTDIWLCSRHGDPVGFVKSLPKRCDCILVTDGSSTTGEPTLLGDGNMPLKEVLAAAESEGGVRFYLIAQEGGTSLPGLQAIEKDLARFRELHS